VPRHSSQLAQKVWGRAPAVVAAQNALMRKLGLATTMHIKTSDFDCYLELFNNGLLEEQARQVDELFMDSSVVSGFASGPVDDLAILRN
jgi:hypothetical protein